MRISAIRTEQGRTGEIVEQAAEHNPGIPAFLSGLASALCRVGRHDEARRIVERGAADGFAGVPRDPIFTTTLALGALAALLENHAAADEHFAAASSVHERESVLDWEAVTATETWPAMRRSCSRP